MNRKELKSMAKQQIKGKIGILFLISLLISIISGSVGSIINFVIPYAGSVIGTIIVTPAFALSLAKIYLMITKGTNPEVKDTFSGFEDFWSAFKVTFLVGLFTFLWSLLFVVPGIIKSISYSMSLYVLAENKEKPALECIKESKKMTQGHKGEIFVLALSFIGWIYLGILTLGFLYIWLIPYMQTTFVNAYNKLKPVKEYEEPTQNSEEFNIPVVEEITQPIEDSKEKDVPEIKEDLPEQEIDVDEKISPAKEEPQTEELMRIEEEPVKDEIPLNNEISPAKEEVETT